MEIVELTRSTSSCSPTHHGDHLDEVAARDLPNDIPDRHHVELGTVSRWRLLDHWDRDLRGLSAEQLRERLELAWDRERSSVRKGMGRKPKAARDWQARRKAVEAELERRADRP